MRARLAALLAAALLAGCGGTPEQVSEIPAEDRAFGAEQHPELLAAFGGAYPGPEAAYVAAVGERVAAAGGLPRQCVFTLVNSDVANAFAVPGCYLYVTRGLMAIMGSEAELAAVLGHEVGHVAHAHSRRQQRRSLWRALGVYLVGLTGSERLTRLAGQTAALFDLRYSRAQEYDADRFGIAALRRAGYDPYAAADMLAALDRQERYLSQVAGRDSARGIPEWASSHPDTRNRTERAWRDAADTGLADDELPENASAYLREVDGLLWGDDPEQGFVLGRTFAHPAMRIAFRAPPGFTLTNSPRAVLLRGGEVRGEFAGGPIPPGGIARYAELLLAQVAGEMPVEVGAAEWAGVNGVPALIVPAAIPTERGRVPVRIAVYDAGGGQAYHFVTVASPDADGAAGVAALFASFRLLSDAEVARLVPRVIRTVAVRPGDSAERFAAAMAGENPLALFRMLNALEPGEQPAAGATVKLVTEAR